MKHKGEKIQNVLRIFCSQTTSPLILQRMAREYSLIDCLNKSWYIHTTTYYRALKNEFQKMETQVNMPSLLTQLQQKLQLDYKTNITQICQKIELYGILTAKDLKKTHSSRQVGRAEAQRGAEGGEAWRCRTGCPTSKLGGIPQEGGIPAPDQTTQPRVPAPGS